MKRCIIKQANVLTSLTVAAVLALTLLLTAFSAPVAAQERNWTGDISAYLGVKALDDKDWPELDNQVALGALFDIKKKSWPVRIAVDVIASGDLHKRGDLKDTALTSETHIGVRKVFELENLPIRPYIGGGIALIYGELEKKEGTLTHTDDDNGVGPWVGGGLYVDLTSHFHLGLDVRYSQAEVKLFDKDREAGGVQAGITLGYHW